MLLLPDGQIELYWEPSKRQNCFVNQKALDRISTFSSSLSVTRSGAVENGRNLHQFNYERLFVPDFLLVFMHWVSSDFGFDTKD
jgi:hypothetical protein